MRSDDVLPELGSYPPVMTPAEVADVLRVNRQHLVALMRSGKFPGFRVGGSGDWRCLRSELQLIMTGQWCPPGGVQPADLDEILSAATQANAV